ncbi:hypothetical protein D6D28_10278 [Aureobasidium pullulans]|uniref:F-box domain-containing protein n=1 Tax=Aureobasidium pullulans TaxID=5580 RepID=A0A4S8S117_AURPU|nr:hypothetical protein D6D28_10278 [Aureobasidium pullulans]
MADHHSHQTSSLKRKRSPPDHAPTSRFKQEDDEPVEQINRSYDQNGSSLVSSLTEHDRYASITDRIIDHLGIVDILALTRTSKSLSNLYNNSLPRHWDIDQRLSRFVTDPTKFRRILGRNNGLIVGSLPLQFFSRLQWDDSSLDILVEKGEAATAMKAHIRSQGYREPNIIDYDMGHSGIHFKRTPWTKAGDSKSTINLITSPEISIHVPSYEKETDTLQNFDNAISSLDGARRIGDVKTWSIPLDCAGFKIVPEVVSKSRSFYETNTFQVVTHREHGKELSYKIHTEAFECCTLRYRYTFDFMEHPRDDFHYYLRYKLCRRAALQIKHHQDNNTFTLGIEETSPSLEVMSKAREDDIGESVYVCPLLEARGNKVFKRPDGWKYADDDIRVIYDEWIKYSYDPQKVKVEIKEEKED